MSQRRRRRSARPGTGPHTSTPRHVLANQGSGEVRVHPRPRVGVLSTGDELFTGTGPLPAGKIRDANRHTLLALVRRETAARRRPRRSWATTSPPWWSCCRRGGEPCDAIFTSGGVSVGDLDLVRVVLEKLCGNMRGGCRSPSGRPSRSRSGCCRLTRPRRSSGCPGTPCRRWSASSCSSGRLFGGWAGTATCTGPIVAATSELRPAPAEPTGSCTSCARSPSSMQPGSSAGPDGRAAKSPISCTPWRTPMP